MNKFLIAAIVLFLTTRLYNLSLLPIFTDEAIYLYWAKYIATNNSNWFMSLTDGKPPLFIWIITFFLKIFPTDAYLIAGRFVSVIAGAITLIGVYKLSLFLFNSKKTAFLAVLLSIFSPFMLLYDRLALFDSFLSAILIWSVYYAVKTSSSFKIKDAVIWGLFLGIALLVKPTAVIFVILTPICYFLLLSKKEIKKNIKQAFLLPVIAVVIGEIINNVQRLSVNYRLAEIKNQQFQIPLEKLLSDPFILFFKNIKEISEWIVSYYTIPILALGALGLFALLTINARKGFILLTLWLIPIIMFAFVGKILFPRYILFTTPYFLIAVAYFLSIFQTKHLKVPLVIILFFLMLFNFYILTNPTIAPFPNSDYQQYITGKHSGYGLEKIFAFLDNELNTGPRITLVTQGKFGLFPYAFRLKYWDDKRIDIVQSWFHKKPELDLYAYQKSSKVYVVLWETETIPEYLPLRLIMRVQKPGEKNSILLTTLK